MENNEKRTELIPDPNRQIQLVVDGSADRDETIDLGNVFHNMKLRRRLFAWVTVLCLTVGLCAPLLLYQMTKSPLTVSSMVILRYEVPKAQYREALANGTISLNEAEFEPVSDLTAPDGEALDVNQISSSYVVKTAIDGMELPGAVTVEGVRANLQIQLVMTEQSQRVKEALAGLAENKNAQAYQQLLTAKITYENRFVVSLKNGFSEDEDDRTKTELTGSELSQLLDRILAAYNEYLVKTYADMQLPEDTFSIIDTEKQDVYRSLEQIREGVDELYEYCDEKTETVEQYRSWQSGQRLADWKDTLNTFRMINVDYLFALVNRDAVTSDKQAMLTSWKYTLRTKQNELKEVAKNIEETDKLISSYQNNQIFLSMQETDTTKSTKTTTEYYNSLILQQLRNFNRAEQLRVSAADYSDWIRQTESAGQTDVTDEVKNELARTLETAREIYTGIRAHMEELTESPLYTTYADYTAAQGKEDNFLTASMKRIIIGVAAGAVISFGLWFLAGLGMELAKDRKDNRKGGAAA